MDQRPAIELEWPQAASGAWAVGVSGGADSVALLSLLRRRDDLSLHVVHLPDLRLHAVHLDHELRGQASAGDAEFVQSLCRRLNVPCCVARRSEIEPQLGRLPSNPSARYRAVRLALFRRVVAAHGLQGVVLAHHGDDNAETVLLRLLRGAGPAGLTGIAADGRIVDLRIVRPLLRVRRRALESLLQERGQPWRQDASNQSDKYLRNRLRKLLAGRPELTDVLLQLAAACRQLEDWACRAAPQLPPRFAAAELAWLPSLLARHAARQWLIRSAAPPGELTPAILDRLTAMAADAATPARQQFPGALTVRRRGGLIWLESAAGPGSQFG
jgi:tRNA(Ile)-lysidine synthase